MGNKRKRNLTACVINTSVTLDIPAAHSITPAERLEIQRLANRTVNDAIGQWFKERKGAQPEKGTRTEYYILRNASKNN